MKLKVYVVELDLSPRQKKIVRAAVVTGSVIGALGVGIAAAAPLNTSWISSGSQVSASSLLSDMTELNRRTIATNGPASYSVGATLYCGQTTTSFTGNLGGYAGGKQACQSVATGCGSSVTAHMCTAEEMVRSAALGITLPAGSGWVASLTGGTVGPGPAWYSECGSAGAPAAAWTQTTPNGGESGVLYGGTWDNGFLNQQPCTGSLPILCCD